MTIINVDNSRRRVLMVVGGGIAAGTTTGIGAITAQQTNEENTPEGSVRVVHLAPDVPTVDVYVNGDLGFEEVDPFVTEPETAPDAAVEDASFVLAITEDAVPGGA